MKNKSVQNCRFVHHAKFHCIMKTLNRLFKTEFERGGGNWKRAAQFLSHWDCWMRERLSATRPKSLRVPIMDRQTFPLVQDIWFMKHSINLSFCSVRLKFNWFNSLLRKQWLFSLRRCSRMPRSMSRHVRPYHCGNEWYRRTRPSWNTDASSSNSSTYQMIWQGHEI